MDAYRISSTLGLSSSLWLSGFYCASSALTLPILYRLPNDVSTDIFAELFTRGSAIIGPLAGLSAISLGVAAYTSPAEWGRKTYSAAAVLTLAVLPWTLIFMVSDINRLTAISEAFKTKKLDASVTGEVGRLLRAWTWKNYVRVGMTLLGGVVGLVSFARIEMENFVKPKSL